MTKQTTYNSYTKAHVDNNINLRLL